MASEDIEELETGYHNPRQFLYLPLAVKLLVKFFQKALTNILPRQMDFCSGCAIEDDEKLHT